MAGPVANNERLIRVLTDRHFKENLQIKPTAISLRDLQDRGVSMVRAAMVDVIEFQAVAEDIRTTANADSVAGALILETLSLRELRWPGGARKLCVIDDPVLNDPDLRDNPAHCATVSSTAISEIDAKELRDQLLTIFNQARYLHELWAA